MPVKVHSPACTNFDDGFSKPQCCSSMLTQRHCAKVWKISTS